MTLLALQRDMRAWLAYEDSGAADRIGARAAPGLRVYQNNYRAQLVACLEASFPRTRAWIGDGAFLAAAASHIDRVPPSSWTLDAYPRDFPDTLAMLYPDDREIAELAWIDFAIEEVFIAPDASVAAADDLRRTDWDRATLRFIPAIALQQVTTNAVAIWSALAEGDSPPALAATAEPAAGLVWRKDQSSHLREIDASEYQALLTMLSRTPFAAMCEEAIESLGEQRGVVQAGQWLGRWVSDGLISAIE